MRRLIVAVVAGACMVVGQAAPSHAEVVRIQDGRDTSAKQELLAVRIQHGKRVAVTLRYSSNYALHAEYPFEILFNTKPARKGAEFGYFSHFGAVYTVKNGDFADQVDCSIRYRQSDVHHTIRLSFAHRCLRGDLGPVRIRVSAFAKTAPNKPMVTDYVPGKRRWSEPVSQY